MDTLEVFLLMEAIAIALLAMTWVLGFVVSQSTPNDPIWLFARTFWFNFLFPVVAREPEKMPLRELPKEKRKRERSDRGKRTEILIKKDQPEVEPEDEEAPAEDSSIATATLGVTATFNADTDRVVGRNAGGLTVEVTNGMTEVAANKVIVQLIASVLGVKPYQVTVTRGHFQAKKGLSITGMSQSDLDEKLERFNAPV